MCIYIHIYSSSSSSSSSSSGSSGSGGSSRRVVVVGDTVVVGPRSLVGKTEWFCVSGSVLFFCCFCIVGA